MSYQKAKDYAQAMINKNKVKNSDIYTSECIFIVSKPTEVRTNCDYDKLSKRVDVIEDFLVNVGWNDVFNVNDIDFMFK